MKKKIYMQNNNKKINTRETNIAINSIRKDFQGKSNCVRDDDNNLVANANGFLNT
jgi:hypothetical protein